MTLKGNRNCYAIFKSLSWKLKMIWPPHMSGYLRKPIKRNQGPQENRQQQQRGQKELKLPDKI